MALDEALSDVAASGFPALAALDARLPAIAAQAHAYGRSDPCSALFKIRFIEERAAEAVGARHGLERRHQERSEAFLDRLAAGGAVPFGEIGHFQQIRALGDRAMCEHRCGEDDVEEAMEHLAAIEAWVAGPVVEAVAPVVEVEAGAEPEAVVEVAAEPEPVVAAVVEDAPMLFAAPVRGRRKSSGALGAFTGLAIAASVVATAAMLSPPGWIDARLGEVGAPAKVRETVKGWLDYANPPRPA